MMCVALLLVLVMWLTLCMAFLSACFAPDPPEDSALECVLEEGREPADTAISREVAARAVCVSCSIALLISVATQYSC